MSEKWEGMMSDNVSRYDRCVHPGCEQLRRNSPEVSQAGCPDGLPLGHDPDDPGLRLHLLEKAVLALTEQTKALAAKVEALEVERAERTSGKPFYGSATASTGRKKPCLSG